MLFLMSIHQMYYYDCKSWVILINLLYSFNVIFCHFSNNVISKSGGGQAVFYYEQYSRSDAFLVHCKFWKSDIPAPVTILEKNMKINEHWNLIVMESVIQNAGWV